MEPVQEVPVEKKVEVATMSSFASTGLWSVFIFTMTLFLAFHVGAGYLSYQKYGSILWAIVDFLFAYFYYPYYAFFLSGTVVEPTLMGGLRRRRKH
jgi:hypothetical protein